MLQFFIVEIGFTTTLELKICECHVILDLNSPVTSRDRILVTTTKISDKTEKITEHQLMTTL